MMGRDGVGSGGIRTGHGWRVGWGRDRSGYRGWYGEEVG